MSEKLPRTVTATEFSSVGAHDGVHETVTSDGETATNSPLASLTARHITRLATLSHAAPGMNDVGCTDASNAPSRAAFARVIVE